MSRIYFHTKNYDDVEVLGMEAHHLHYLGKVIGTGILYDELQSITNQIPINSWINIPNHNSINNNPIYNLYKHYLNVIETGMVITSLSVGLDIFGDCPRIKYNDKWLNAWPWFLTMNAKYGSDVMCLIGQMSAQMEIYAHVRKDNLQWFANLISKGLEQNILREDMGWTKVIDLCKKDDVELVVMSYSVCQPFVCGENAKCDDDEFYNLSADDQWDLCVKYLDPSVEITPDSIRNDYE